MPRIIFVFLTLLSACQTIFPQKDTATQEYLKQYTDQKQALVVDYYAPTGLTEVANNKIVVHFSQPMVPLTVAGEQDRFGLVTVTPGLDGYFKWVNTKTLVYQLKGDLPYATHFTVTVAAARESLFGHALTKDFVFEFETPRPQIQKVFPAGTTRNLNLDQEFRLVFNQKMDPSVLKDFVQLTASGTPHALKTFCIPPEDKNARPEKTCTVVMIAPRLPFGKNSQVVLTVKSGIKGVQGHLLSDQEYADQFYTYGPFQITNGSCGSLQCFADGGFVLGATTPIDDKQELEKFILFDPPLTGKGKLTGYWSDYTGRFSSYAPLKPNTHYTVTVKPEIKDRFGQALEEPFVFSITTARDPPQFHLPSVNDQVLHFHDNLNFGFVATNVVSATAHFKLDLTDTEIIALKTHGGETISQIEDEGRWTVAREVTGALSDRREYYSLPAEEVLADRHSAIVLADYTSPALVHTDSENRIVGPRHHWLIKQITDLAIDAKLSETDGLVWITSLTTGQPQAQTRIKVYSNWGGLLHEVVTDSSGFARLPGWKKLKALAAKLKKEKFKKSEDEPAADLPSYIFAEKGSDRAFITTDWAFGWGYGYEDEWQGEEDEEKVAATEPENVVPVKLRAHLLTDRGLYKPGEEVHIKGYVREVTDKGLMLFKQPLVLEVTPPREDKPVTINVMPNDRGNFTAVHPLSAEDPLGGYSVALSGDQPGLKIESGQIWFQVEKFRTPDFKTEAAFSEKSFVKGEPVSVSVTAEYLFGAPLKGATVNYSVGQSLSFYDPPNDEGFAFGRLYEHREQDETVLAGKYEEKTANLDERGSLTFEFTAEDGLVDPVQVRVGVESFDLSGQSQAASASVLVHPAAFYVGASVPHLFHTVGETATVQFAVLSPDGTAIAGRDVTADLMRVKWVSVKEELLDGQFKTATRREEVRVDGCVRKAQGDGGTCAVPVKESGYYFFKLTAVDDKNRPAVTEIPFYVNGPDYAWWPDEDSHSLELIADRGSYTDGETARIMIKSPYQSAHALISIERDHILSYEVRDLSGSTPVIEIPIKPEHAPNVFVRVVLIKGTLEKDLSVAGTDESAGQALVRAGELELTVEPQGKKLELEVASASPVYEPGETVDLNFSVTGTKDGAEAEITVMVVDEGVLLAGGYALSDPLWTFFAPYSHGVTQMDARLRYVGMQGLEEKLAQPSSGGGQESGFRKEFIPLAYFNGELMTQGGKARASFRLPDQLTNYVVMAIANSAVDQFGLARSAFQTQKDIMIRPALPRFVRAGDTVSSRVVLHNNTGEDQIVSVLVTSDQLKVGEGARGSVTIPRKSSAAYPVHLEVPKPTATSDPVSSAQVQIAATAGEVDDRVAVTIPVYLERPEEVTAISGVVAGEVTEFAEKSDDTIPTLGGLDIVLEAGLLHRITDRVQRLRGYPYGCLEQRVSKLMPLLLFPGNNDVYSEREKDPAVRQELVRRFITYLKSQQKFTGGFSFWPGQTQPESPALTLMVAEFLIHAREAGYDVESVLEKIQKRLFDYLNPEHQSLKGYSQDYVDRLRVNTLYALYLMGQPQPSYYYLLKLGLEQFDLLSQARVVEMVLAQDANDAIARQWLTTLNNKLRLKGETAYVEAPDSDFYFGYSPRAATAVVMQTLLKTDPAHPFIFPLLKFLLGEKHQGSYTPSLEGAAVLRALNTYQNVFPTGEQPVQVILSMNDTELIRSQLGPKKPQDRLDIPMDRLPPSMTLKIKKETGDFLFYDIKYRTVRKTHRPYGLEQGITLSRQYFDLDGHEVKASDLKHGKTYRAVLNFYFADASDYVVVEEPVGAGLEPVNFALKNVNFTLRDGEYRGNSDLSWYLTHREFHDQKILLFADAVPRGFYEFSYFVNVTNGGSYLVPPARAMEMYNPEIFGTTGAEKVVAH